VVSGGGAGFVVSDGLEEVVVSGGVVYGVEDMFRIRVLGTDSTPGKTSTSSGEWEIGSST